MVAAPAEKGDGGGGAAVAVPGAGEGPSLQASLLPAARASVRDLPLAVMAYAAMKLLTEPQV